MQESNPKVIIPFDSNFEAAYALNRGEIDAWVAVSRDTFSYIVRTERLENIMQAGPTLRSEERRCFVRREDTALAALLTDTLGAMLADGTINTINRKWTSNLKQPSFIEAHKDVLLWGMGAALVIFLAALVWIRQLRVRVKAATTDLEVTAQRYLTLIDSSPDLIFLIGDDGVVRKSNTIARRVLGVEDKPSGRMLFEGIVPKDRQRFQAFVKGLFAEGVAAGEFKLENANGGLRELDMSGVVLPRSPEWGREACLIARDVTDRKTMERELAKADKLATVGTAAAALAHEINTPIGTALTYAKTLAKKNSLQEEQEIYLLAVQRNLVRAGRITQDLLSLSKPREPKMQVLTLDAVVKDVLETNALQFGGMDVDYRVDDVPKPQQIFGDPVLLGQVLMNLLLNAKNATSGMTERMATIWQTVDEEAKAVGLHVRDNGKGISPERIGNIFEIFNTEGKHGGFGLGLYISRQIVELHNGSITVESEENKGSLFSIEIPIL